jgi:hypothetical protein
VPVTSLIALLLVTSLPGQSLGEAAERALESIRSRVSVTPVRGDAAALSGCYLGDPGVFHVSELCLFPDATYLAMDHWDISTTIFDKGRWRVEGSGLELLSDPDVTWSPTAERRYAVLRRSARQDEVIVVGLEEASRGIETPGMRDLEAPDAPWRPLLAAGLLRRRIFREGEAPAVKADLLAQWWAPESFAKQGFSETLPEPDRERLAMLTERCKAQDAEACEALAQAALHADTPQVREAAVQAVDDQVILAKVAGSTAETGRVRAAAVGRVANQTLLARLATDDSDSVVRLVAVQRLEDGELLAAIAEGDASPGVREVATGRLRPSQQGPLARIADNDPSPGVQCAAIGILPDQQRLARLAQADDDSRVRVCAIRQLTDQGLLARLARSDGDPSVRTCATERLKDQALLTEIAESDTNPNVREAATRALAPSQQPALVRLAEHDDWEGVRAIATQKITDPSVLARIAEADGSQDVAMIAARQLQDPALLASVARASRHDEVRAWVVEVKLRDPAVLEEIARSDDIELVRSTARERLGSLSERPERQR